MMLDMRRLVQRFIRLGLSKARGAVKPPASSLPPPIRIPDTHAAAAAGLAERSVVDSGAFRKREYTVPFDGSDVDIIAFAQAFTKELKARGMPFYVHCLYRGKDEQNQMYRNGVSKARWGKSPHNFGMAVDIIHFKRGWDLSKKEWAVIGLIGYEVARRKNIAIEWGGDWSFYDPAHWELADWRERVESAA